MKRDSQRKVTAFNQKHIDIQIRDEPSPDLIEMLAKAPKEAFELTEADREFLNSTVGNEIINDG